MQRVLGHILLALGVFAVGLGILLRTWAYPALAKVPVNIDKTSVAQGSNITALLIDEKDGVPDPKIESGLSLTSTTHVTGDLTAPEVKKDGDVAAWIEASRVTDDASGIVVTAGVRLVCVNRHTNMAVAPCEHQYLEDETQGDKVTAPRSAIQQPGLSFKFPFGTDKSETYKYYDSSIRATADAKFDGEDVVKGLAVYRFVQTIPPTRIGEKEVPGSLIGKSEQVVKADLYYEAKRTLWVEPVSGAIVNGREEGKQELRVAGEGPGEGEYVFNGTLQLNDRTVTGNVEEAEKNKSKLWLLTTLPWILLVAGGVLAVVGVVLLVVSRGTPGKRSLGNPPRQPVGAGT
ncbi:MAG TPA: DUF3068 domain-containing protein [Actinokineospora sp.]|nr:DUF3068 domain-containing protein [Actinokineospora sp.]